MIRNLKNKNSVGAFPIVGIGASAGGIASITELLSRLPADAGLAIVFISHMDPNHESQMPQLLSRSCRLKVTEAKDKVRVEKNKVYVIPPNCDLKIFDGVLHLIRRQKNKKPPYHLPIDMFFKSLAADQKEDAFGVILSGTGSDGSQGILAIKAEGGLTFVQDEASSQYPDMPKAAMALTNVDYVLPCKAIADELVRLAASPSVPRRPAPASAGEQDPFSGHEDQLPVIFDLLTEASGTDFSRYKPSTIHRRILRRMVLHRLESLSDYVGLLKSSPTEKENLRREMLISVTGFFRDPDSFEALKKKVFPEIFKDKSAQVPLRAWVPGCSSGEEAYSLAICLLESLTEKSRRFPIQIFGSDINEDVLEKARSGIYTESDVAGMDPQRLRRFFTKVQGGYQINKIVRETCIFAKQDLTRDPPFSKMDLISCRNLLIYLGAGLQSRVFSVFHYALKPFGFLMLGTAENIGNLPELFAFVDKKNKIYSRKSAPGKLPRDFGGSLHARTAMTAAPASLWDKFDLEKEANRAMLARFVPAAVVINEDLTILRFQGHLQPYLDPTTGGASLSLPKVTAEGLAGELRGAVTEAAKRNVEVTRRGIPILRAGRYVRVSLQVVPLLHPGGKEKYYVVLFRDEKDETPASKGKGKKSDSYVPGKKEKGLREDLERTRGQLQAIIEAEENTNQELRAANEEILSSNEELQSTNEEMETAKEELQSTNEELTTVNEELTDRNEQLARSNADLNNVLVSGNLPIILLDSDLRIRHFTPMAATVMNLLPGDTGRPITDFKPNIDVPDLERMIRQAIETSEPQEREVMDKSGYWYLLQVRPYFAYEKKIEGAVIVLFNIDSLKKTMNRLTEASHFSEMIIESILNPVLVLDSALRVKKANKAFYRFFRVSSIETIGESVYELGNGQWNIPSLRQLLDTELGRRTEFSDFEVEHSFPHIGPKMLLLNACVLNIEKGERTILVSIQDLTKHWEAIEKIKKSEEMLRSGKLKQKFAAMTSHELRTPLTAIKEGIDLVLEELDGPITDEQKENLLISRNNVDRLTQLINNLLNLTRMDSGQFPVTLAKADLSSLVRENLGLMKRMVDIKGVSLTVRTPAKPIRAVCDAEKIGQMVTNLVDNALKFTPKGGAIGVDLKRENGGIVLAVSDTGAGIKKEDQRKIFEFLKGDQDKMKKGSGFGIGLFICKSIMEGHRGQIDVQSALGKGATFTATFPANLGPSAPRSEAARRPSGSERKAP